ncbi:MAG: AMP-binding protein [Pseudomonadota bacterium]
MIDPVSVSGPIDEALYLADLHKRQQKAWPAGIPRGPVYPFGEVALTEYLRQWARKTPEKTLFNFYGREISFAEIDLLSDQCAAMLQDTGVRPGDRVAVFLGNCPQFAVAFFGILKAGAVHVPVNPMFKEHELLYELQDTDATVMIADHALVPLALEVQDQSSVARIFGTGLAEMIPAVPTIPVPDAVLQSPASSQADPFLPAVMAAGEPTPVTPDLDDVAALNYTGGTTGMPKGCVHTQRDMIYTAATACITNCPSGPDDVVVNFYPLFWIAGEDLGLILPVFSGATCILMARWDALGYMTAVDRYKVTRAVLLVDNAAELLDHPRLGEFDLTSFRTSGVSSFVKKLNKDFRDRWRDLTGATIAELSYGMTETHTCDSFTFGFQDDDFDLSLQPILCGLPVPGTEFKICDFETHELLPIGAEGEICVRSPSNLKSYWNKPDATAESIVNGWLRTGDIGMINENGMLHFLGRRKEMLKVKGMSVFPAELEALLGRHPAIVGSGVIGRPDADRGQVPVAFVLIDPDKSEGITEDALTAWCRDAMAVYKRPEIRIVETLPMTATGKVKKHELEALL